MRERWRWHGRPAREITRKLRVPHLNCATFERRRMISDWRDWGHSGEGQKEKRSRDPLSPTRFSPDKRTQSARRTPKSTLLDCCRSGNQCLQRKKRISLALQANSRRARTNLALRAATCVQGCDAAAQIFKLNIFKSCCTNHANQSFLIREFPNRFWQVFISASRTTEPSPDHWQQS